MVGTSGGNRERENFVLEVPEMKMGRSVGGGSLEIGLMPCEFLLFSFLPLAY